MKINIFGGMLTVGEVDTETMNYAQFNFVKLFGNQEPVHDGLGTFAH